MTRSGVRLTAAQARRIALAAQGFGRPRPSRPVGMRDVQASVNRLAQFQIDSVNVVARAHFVPLYSRFGPYDTAMLERAAHRPPRRLFEYWGHAASLIDVSLQPALRHRMHHAGTAAWSAITRISQEHPGLVDRVYAEVAQRGPLTARQIEHAEVRSRDAWGWNWSAVKTSLEWLFVQGRVAAAYRTPQFERAYDLPERVLPASVTAAPTPDEPEAHLTLVRRAAQALGVASERCLADYFRTGVQATRRAVSSLVAGGELVPAEVAGWPRPAYLWHDAARPRTVTARALLSPFDSLVFERSRLEALFAFTYRIEIYVPASQRQHGYYVYPFLLDDRFVARVDLKADRALGVLRVQAAWGEPDIDRERVATELAAELAAMADWLKLVDVTVDSRGDLAAALARRLRP